MFNGPLSTFTDEYIPIRCVTIDEARAPIRRRRAALHRHRAAQAGGAGRALRCGRAAGAAHAVAPPARAAGGAARQVPLHFLSPTHHVALCHRHIYYTGPGRMAARGRIFSGP